jgi:hypothetical protein
MSYKLNIRLISARDLPKMDLFGKSDPYCVLTSMTTGMTFKSSVKKNTLTPRWNEDFHFPVESPEAEYLCIEMYDKDATKDDKMSEFRLSLGTLKLGAVVDMWYDMSPVPGVKKGGQIHVILHLARPQDQPFMMKENIPEQECQDTQPPMMSQPPPMMYQPPPQQPMMYQPPPQQPMMYQPPPQQPMMYQQQQPMMMGQPMQQPMMYPQQPMMNQQPMMYQQQPMMYQQPMMQQPQGSGSDDLAKKLAMSRARGGY